MKEQNLEGDEGHFKNFALCLQLSQSLFYSSQDHRVAEGQSEEELKDGAVRFVFFLSFYYSPFNPMLTLSYCYYRLSPQTGKRAEKLPWLPCGPQSTMTELRPSSTWPSFWLPIILSTSSSCEMARTFAPVSSCRTAVLYAGIFST